MFNYKEYNRIQSSLGAVEEKVIKAHWDLVVDPKSNDSFEDKSGPEMRQLFWMFRHAWILSQMFTNPKKG